MKIALSISLVLVCGSIVGQNLTVTHSKIPVSDVTADVWSANLNDNVSFYEETFEDFTKQEFGQKSQDDGKNEEILEKASIPQITNKRGDLRLTFYTEGNVNKMGLSFLLGYDVWINPTDYPDEMERLRKFTREYLRFHYTQYYNDIIDSDTKLIGDYKKSIEKSEKSISNMRGQISKNEEKLTSEDNTNRKSSLERKNEQNKTDIERLEAEIPDLQEKISSLDEHILQIKDKLKFVEEQYYADEETVQN
jgi:gas vesicle protein